MSFNFHEKASQPDPPLVQFEGLSLGSPQSRHKLTPRTRQRPHEAGAVGMLSQKLNSAGAPSQVKVEADQKSSSLPSTPPKQNLFFPSLNNVPLPAAISSPTTPPSQSAGHTCCNLASTAPVPSTSSTFSFSPVPKTSPKPESVFSFDTPPSTKSSLAPLFSFGFPLTPPSRSESHPPEPQPVFSLGIPSATKNPPPTAPVTASSSTFSFGSPLTPPPTITAQRPSQPLFSFGTVPGTKSIVPTTQVTPAAPRFTLGSSSTPESTAKSQSPISASSLFSPQQVRGADATKPQEPEAQAPRILAPYNAGDEPAPAHSFFTPVFQTALKDGLNLASEASAAIQNLTSTGLFPSDNDIAKFLDEAKLLTKFQASDTRTIAVLGDSGEGKSSLINSLLHFPDVAQTGDIGSACTSVVTEYRQKKANHVAPIVIEVEYLSESGIQEMIHELLWSYRRLYLPGVESNETSEQDYAKYTRESEQAWSALKAAFSHERQFTPQFAQDMSEGASDRIYDRLIQWAREIQWPSAGTEGFWTTTAQTAEECVKHAKVFMQDKYWPFTKMIRVYLDSPVLRNGVVLADLPGLQDTNLARVRATQDYLIKCDNIFIVAKISRAITDQSLKSSLFYVLSRHVPMEWEQSGAQNFKIAVVCTKSEELNLKTARTEFCGPTKRIKPTVMAQLDKEIEEAKSAGDRNRKKSAKKKQELLLVEARNTHVKENLQRVYSSEMEGKSLEVFCVSNKWYEKYCPKGKTELVQASGVPELRRFCHTITADAQLSEAKYFLKSKLSTLLNSLDIWASSVQSASKAHVVEFDESIYDDFDEAKSEIMPLAAEFRKSFSDCFQEQIIKIFVGREQHWDRASAHEGRKWHSWHWSNTTMTKLVSRTTVADQDVAAQYNAWCLNNGNHETLKRGREDWNAKIIWKMRMELEYQWDLVQEEVPDAFETMIEGVKSSMSDLRTRVQVISASENVSRLVSGIDSQMESIEYKMQREQARFLAEVKSIRRYASDSNYTSYILQDMLPSYRSAAGQEGTGKAARQRHIVQGHIEGETIFPQLAIAISASMNDLLTASEGILDDILGAALTSIKRDLDMVFRSQVGLRARSAADEKTRDSQVKQFADAVTGLKERHGNLLGSIE